MRRAKQRSIPKSSNSIINYIIRLMVSPLKYMDLFLIRRPDAHRIASGFYFCGVKET